MFVEQYHKSYSENLNREMEYAVFGDKGKVCFVFPPQDGRFYDFNNFGMVDVIKPWIERDKVRLICVDGIDSESWSSTYNDPRTRIEFQEKWFHYVVDELYPMIVPPNEKAMATGCSMGGFHSGIFFFRRPDLFDIMLSLSGLFNAQFFFHEYIDDLVYDNSPSHFLRNMPDDHPWIDLYKKGKIIACVGQGAWEDDLLYLTRDLDTILTEKNIPHQFDYWGYDVSHDWPWWKKQLAYFSEQLFG